MDANEEQSNSRVVVQCVDPDDLFDRLGPRLSARSPLKNLHWKSPSRPLRSIPNLDISLTREEKNPGTQSLVRRHQIPGLRQTPYVKIYLVRCDDKETYKDKVRKEVKQWVKNNTPAAEGKSTAKLPEGHDAFEWMILHVVLPNTQVANQPRSSKHISAEAAESTDSVNSKSKWTGKSSTTVFDKLRADFNSTSKSGVHRVAQVRLLDPQDRSPVMSPAELEEQWQEAVEMLKACILRSFDARVSQYEIDIRERDNQRSLPGWNFCTFFILKEGLAKGFESVGLLEDALVVYDELALVLDTLVREQAENNDSDENGALLPFSRQTKALLRAALEGGNRSFADTSLAEFELRHILSAEKDKYPLDVERKKYQDRILSNEVSALDFQIYLFTREMDILLRLAHRDSHGHAPGKSAIDLNIAADVAERASQFISLASRNLKFELYNAWGGQEGLSDEELHTQQIVTGNIVSSWMWHAIMQTLNSVMPALGPGIDDWTSSLDLDIIELAQNLETRPDERNDSRPRRLSVPDAKSPSRELSQDRSYRASLAPNGNLTGNSIPSRPGAERLALWVAKLVLMARRILTTLDGSHQWFDRIKSNALFDSAQGDNGLLDKKSADSTTPTVEASHEEGAAGLESDILGAMALSKEKLFDLYSFFSILAYRLFVAARCHTSAQQVLVDLAELEYFRRNYGLAARYLGSILGILPRATYRCSEEYLLSIFADCLEHLDKPSEHARCLIACLHPVFLNNNRRKALLSPVRSMQSYMDHLFEVAKRSASSTLSLQHLFDVSEVACTLSHHAEVGGFTVSLSLRTHSRTLTPQIDEVKLRLASRDGEDPHYVALRSKDSVTIGAELKPIVLTTRIIAKGWYCLDELELRIGNLRLLHHFETVAEHEQDDLSQNFKGKSPAILLYPHQDSLAVSISPSPVIHLAEIRKLWVELKAGRNEVKQCKLRLKAATAGLRLNIHDSRLVGEAPASSWRTAREGETMMIVIDSIDFGSTAIVEIPYSVEFLSEPSLTVRIEANYENTHGNFVLHDAVTCNAILPVTVNVQDIFRGSGNDSFEAEPGGNFGEILIVSPKQLAHWTVKLTPISDGPVRADAKRITLVVEYQCVDELIVAALEKRFMEAIRETEHADAAQILFSHLVTRIRCAWTQQDLEAAGMLQEIRLWDYRDIAWESILSGFDRGTRADLEYFLEKWHSQEDAVKFSTNGAAIRQLKLHFDIPPPPVIVYGSLLPSLAPGHYTATIGQPLKAELLLSLANCEEGVTECSFELNAPAESWLIGGRRRGCFTLCKEPVKVHLVLFPQHLGHVLLPAITIKCRKQANKQAGKEWIDVLCDVQNPTRARSILVTPNLESTTVDVFDNAPVDLSGRLVTSRHRLTNG